MLLLVLFFTSAIVPITQHSHLLSETFPRKWKVLENEDGFIGYQTQNTKTASYKGLPVQRLCEA